MRQWEREQAIAKEARIEATHETKSMDALEMIRFDIDEGIPHEKTILRLKRIGLDDSTIDKLFEQVDSETVALVDTKST